jgi:hypothetical protein
MNFEENTGYICPDRAMLSFWKSIRKRVKNIIRDLRFNILEIVHISNVLANCCKFAEICCAETLSHFETHSIKLITKEDRDIL